MAGVEGRVALVTGAGRGIGREVAELLASRGARVMGVARSEKELAAVGLEYTVADLGTVERGYGRAIYTSSTAGEFAEHAGSAYNCSKHGLLGLMRSVAQDGGAFGITSNAVLPGWVRTAMAERSARAEAEKRNITPELVWEERAAGYLPGRVATPREVAEMIAFLASEESSGVSGQAITVALGGI